MVAILLLERQIYQAAPSQSVLAACVHEARPDLPLAGRVAAATCCLTLGLGSDCVAVDDRDRVVVVVVVYRESRLLLLLL